jgi:hypothetical protein
MSTIWSEAGIALRRSKRVTIRHERRNRDEGY